VFLESFSLFHASLIFGGFSESVLILCIWIFQILGGFSKKKLSRNSPEEKAHKKAFMKKLSEKALKKKHLKKKLSRKSPNKKALKKKLSTHHPKLQ
jgi:hypothetical protein